MFLICSLYGGHGDGVQGGIAGARIERRGLSPGLRYGGAMPRGAGPVALAARLRLPRLRSSRALRAGGAGALPVQPLQEADLAHGGHDLPCDQAAAEALVRGHPPDRDGEERRLVGGTRPPARGQAADGLGHEAQDHGGDGAARRRDAALGPGGDGRRLSRRQALRRQAGPGRRRQDALRGGGLDRGRGAPAQAQAGAGQGLPQARDRAWRGALAGAGKHGRHRRPRLLACARRGRLQPSPGAHRLGTQSCSCGLVQMGQYDARQHQERDHRDLPQAWPRPCRALPRQLRLALPPALPPQDHDPPLRP